MSKYPIVTRLNAERIADLLRAVPVEQRRDLPVPDREMIQERRGGTFDSKAFEVDCRALETKWISMATDNPDWTVEFLEIQIAGPLFEVIGTLPIDLREDEDFWRYLALFPLRWYLLAREPELQPQDYGGLHGRASSGTGASSGDGQSQSNTAMSSQLMYRTYLIGKAMRDESQTDHYSRRSSIKNGGPVTDIWQSHVVRVRIGRIGKVAHALVDRVAGLAVGQKDFARDLAKKITRLKNNISLDIKDKVETDQIVSNQ
jgi:hypothetical protein